MRKCEVCNKNESETKIHRTSKFGDEKILCSKHYQRLSKYGRLDSTKDEKKNRTCDICGINNSDSQIWTTEKFGVKQNLCKRHYEQLDKRGKIIKNTRLDGNEIIECENHIEIILYDKEGEESGKTFVSKKHKELISNYRWWMVKNRSSKTYYVYGQRCEEKVSLHQLIAREIYGECPLGMSVDHLNRNGLDNRDENLKYKDSNDQAINKGVRSDNQYGITGVSYHKQADKWRTRLKYKGIERCELFDTFEEAVNKRKEWEQIRDSGGWFFND